MSFAPIAYTIPNYRDFKNYWLKAYEPGTTTPKSMSDNETGSPLVAKYEINKDGFPKSAGGTLVIPFISGAYDLWAFPTEAEADANDTSNAERFADDLIGVNSSDVKSSILSLPLADAIAKTDAVEDQQVRIKDRDNGLFEYKTGQVANGNNIIQTDNPLLTLNIADQTSENVKLWGAKGDYNGTSGTDDFTSIQAAFDSDESVNLSDGDYLISQQLISEIPKYIYGNGATSKVTTTAGFTGSIFRIAPNAGTDPKLWKLSDFQVTSKGSSPSIILIDINSPGEFVSKLVIENVISNTQPTNNFLELINGGPNIDGFFTSVIRDNWSFGGYFLDNVGDSVILERNTTTGGGYGYYINELNTAANIIIRDGNSTVDSNALSVIRGSNIIFEGMQVECPATFTGVNNAIVSLDHQGGGLIFNVKIINNNINPQGNALYAIYTQEADQVIIDGNNLYCDPATGAHVFIDSLSRNTIIGNNKYFDSTNGGEIDPIIIDNGVGTSGIWKDATLTLAGWASQGTGNEHPVGFSLSLDGTMQLRGRAAGPASTPGDTLFTLPVGFRPKDKAYLVGTFGAAGASNSVVIQILPTGSVQLLTSAITSVYLNGVVFSIR